MLKKVFGETWVRTDKSVQAYKADLPICSQESSMDALREKIALLRNACNLLLNDENAHVSEEDRTLLTSLLDRIEETSEYDALNALYDSLNDAYQSANAAAYS